jgi:hypothetical protein
MASTRDGIEPGLVAALTRVPRGRGGERVLTALTPSGSRAYTVATLRAAGGAERRLGHEVVANRIDAGGRLEPWRRAHARWRCDLAAAARECSVEAVFKGDVRDCYGAMSIALVGRRLTATGADIATVRTVLELLDACAEQGVRGLPVGPGASAVLANVVMATVDDRLRSAGLAFRRWVDDVVVLAPGRRGGLVAHDAFRRGLDELGLAPNPEKTRVMNHRVEIVRLVGSKISPLELPAMG